MKASPKEHSKKQTSPAAIGCAVILLLSLGSCVVCSMLTPDFPLGKQVEQTKQANRKLAQPTPAEHMSAQGAGNSCEKHIEIHDGKFWAKELGRSEMWVLANHRINLWQNPRPGKGRKVGQLRVGSRALILEEKVEDYRVKSPLDAFGWVSKMQIARTLYQRVETFEACTPPK